MTIAQDSKTQISRKDEKDASCALTGNRFTFAKLLQKFLAGLKHSLSGDLSNHAVIVGMGKGAKSICEGLNARYSHHCVLSSYWVGHDTEYDAVSSCPSQCNCL